MVSLPDNSEPVQGEIGVYIDYAHTPDALEKTLEALRPIAEARGGQLICMFGCGGDRDAAKRPMMGAIAEKNADHVVITSDNPRSEDPLAIIDQVAAGFQDASKARRIEDRASAILQAIRTAARWRGPWIWLRREMESMPRWACTRTMRSSSTNRSNNACWIW